MFATLLGVLLAAPADRPELLVADFEGETYGEWKTTGTAFGPGPAAGPLPGQMEVTGYLGKRFVNSFYKGDGSTGTLTSPAFKVGRKYLNFLVGGGGHAGKTCVNLLRDGKVVRTATGPNTAAGGSERLDWHTWDVGEFEGQEVVIRIVDDHTGGWGHINADHFVQGDAKKQAEPASRDISVAARYLFLPVKTGATKRRVVIADGGNVAREFEIELAEGEPSFWAFVDVGAFKGKTLRLTADRLPPGSKVLDAVTQGDTLKAKDEPGRPKFHFTSRRGWLNDPNGLVYHQGEWHLFYQHNPYGWDWGNMHWGHAVSTDLLHWDELPIALYPKSFGDWAFSGSAVVDKGNTSGMKVGKEDVLALAYTSTGRGECIAFSNDRGRTWTEFPGNPVVKHQGRDPKLVWHAPTKQWVMAVYDEHAGKQWIAFHTSPDLKAWRFRSRIEGYFECPDLFELPVGGDVKNTKWVLTAADGKYAVGSFDGATFTPDHAGKRQVWYGNFYAAQTYDNAPGGRRVQIGWAQGIAFPSQPFNQQMNLPVELTLRPTGDGPRLFAEPVAETKSIRGKAHEFAGELKPGAANPFAAAAGHLFDVELEFTPGETGEVGVSIRGTTVIYHAAKKQLTCGKHTAPLAPEGGVVRLRVVADEGSVEAFGNDGRVAISAPLAPDTKAPTLSLFARGTGTVVKIGTVHDLMSTRSR